ncbi:DUF2812 domain-containing protein [Bacillus spizizenii]|nr:DUF2812 domain-containing protein [Bacillus spizizenii]MCY8226482.1 DUF2812 domain-containing protein [Bacillus spizizenii]MCY8887384.1 DUF2812 domain-containing protein [Bacillus spizizenii]MEC0842815.1 DUF2812 domain-containing protein [Bacillus spizizenii]
MKRKKYMMSEGLAFSEEKDMKRLSDMACKGWVLDSFAFMGYKLRKAEPQNLIYSLDYRAVNDDSMDEYLDIFENAGWEQVCSEYTTHIFAAAPGTKPIYSDRSTLIDKYKQSEYTLRYITLFMLCLTAAFTVIRSMLFSAEATVLHNTIHILFIFLIAITIPATLTYAAAIFKIWRVKRRNPNLE